MQSLTDLCLNQIEKSGADTRELAESGAVLPTKMWTRHPVLQLKGSYYLEVGGPEVTLITDIEVSYTGVYTLKCHIHLAGELTEEERKACYAELKMTGPIQFEKTYQSLEGELTDEQIAWFRNQAFIPNPKDIPRALEFAQQNVLVVEVGRLLYGTGRSSYVDCSIVGSITLKFPEWPDYMFSWAYLQMHLHDLVLFIGAHVSV